jgi:hypothetical protein
MDLEQPAAREYELRDRCVLVLEGLGARSVTRYVEHTDDGTLEKRLARAVTHGRIIGSMVKAGPRGDSNPTTFRATTRRQAPCKHVCSCL